MRIVVWVVEGTWEGCVDAAVAALSLPIRDSRSCTSRRRTSPKPPTRRPSASSGAASPGADPTRSYDDVADDEASQLLAAAAARLGHADVELLSRRGRVEREVVRAVAEGVDVLVVARDGDHSRLGPKSLGHATRFIVDHAPCAVLLVWPDETPGIDSIPPPKHGPPPPHGPRPPHRRD